jgi:multicomponent K+:H+ antiporter subunit A
MRIELLILLLSPFAAAAAMSGVANTHRKTAAWVAATAALLGCAMLAATAGEVFGGQVLRWSVQWLPALGLQFGFRMDGLAWMFALLICGMGALVVLYAAYYLSSDDPPARFFMFLLLFMGAMLGVVLADNLILLVVFWELTSLSSFLLIGFWRHRQDARQGARMALTVTGAGGLCLLAGVLMLGHIVGSFSLDVVLASGELIRAHPMYVPALVLILLGCFTKSAQFPFHFWLPHAMAAPTPVSAYLHSATMVKAGVFLLARLYPALGNSDPWFWMVSLTGLATLVFGAYVAIFKHDLKGLLAYSTISHLGLITLLFGLDEPLAVVAGVFHILNHATFKASLFMAAGIIDHETGSRDMRQLNGLMKYMPITGVLAIVASLSMAGVPLFNGFLSKEMFFAETVAKQGHQVMGWLLPLGATLAGALSVAYSLRFVHDVFFNGEPVGLTKTPHEPPRFMRAPVELLVVVCLAVGLMPQWIIGPLLAVGAQAALFGAPGAALPAYKLVIWHGFNLPLLMSAVALTAGVVLYFVLQRFVNLHRVERVPAQPRRGGKEVLAWKLDTLVQMARRVTQALENHRLQTYLMLLVLTALVAGFAPFVLQPAAVVGAAESPPASLGFVLIWVLGMAAAVATVVLHAQRFLALILLGAVGLVVSLCFVYLSAPDLALTQLLVEVATIVLMMLALRWLPQHSPREKSQRGKWFRGLVACAAGTGVAALTYVVLSHDFNSISLYFLSNSVGLGGGANAVNVIIVDFRAFDTLGEITVLGIAAIAIFSLLPQPASSAPHPAPAVQPESLMLALVSRLLLPMAAVVAVFLFLRGHNQPGGGFIAGLVLAIVLILQFVAHGQAWMGARMGADFRPWVAWGLLVAGMAGVVSWFFSAPFLTSSYDYPRWPGVLGQWLGSVPLASASVFDLGVFLTVVGATMVVLIAIAQLQEEPK